VEPNGLVLLASFCTHELAALDGRAWTTTIDQSKAWRGRRGGRRGAEVVPWSSYELRATVYIQSLEKCAGQSAGHGAGCRRAQKAARDRLAALHSAVQTSARWNRLGRRWPQSDFAAFSTHFGGAKGAC